MIWTVTYRLPGYRSSSEDTATLDAEWCAERGIDPGDLDSPEQAAWAVALMLGGNGQDDAELITVDGDGGPP